MRIQEHPKVTLVQHVGSDVMIAAAAKVSVSGEAARELEATPEDGSIFGLINYLMKQRHGSPFEHGLTTFFVHAPLFVIRELQRHRIASYNEESGRYKQLEPVFWSPDRDRKIARTESYRAARPTFTEGSSEQFRMISEHDELFRSLYEAYEEEIAAGIANEVARRLLPLATYSSTWVTMNPRGLMNFLSLRVADDASAFRLYPQREIEEVAIDMEGAFAEYWPLTHKAFVRNGRVAP